MFKKIILGTFLLTNFFCFSIERRFPEFKEIEAIAKSHKDVISFCFGNLALPRHEKMNEYDALVSLIKKNIYIRQNMGLKSLREGIASFLKDRYKTNFSYKNVIVTRGVSGALRLLCKELLEPDDQVLLLEPSFPGFFNIIHACQREAVAVQGFEMRRDSSGEHHWEFVFENIEKAVSNKTRMLIISNPLNPTGSFLQVEDFLRIKDLCESRGIFFVVDEIYGDFLFDGDYTSVAPFIPESDLLIRVMSFSKSLISGGQKMGYLVGSEYLVQLLSESEWCFLPPSSNSAQVLTLFGLQHCEQILSFYRDMLKESKEIACTFFDWLQEKGIVSYVDPKAGFFIFFKPVHDDASDLVMEILDKAKVALAPGKDFGESFESYIRICFVRSPDIVAEGVRRLKEFFIKKYNLEETPPTTSVVS